MSNVAGSCTCGAVTYRVAAAVRRVVNCHCDMCRKMNGSAFSSYAVVPHDALELSGEQDLGSYAVTERATKHYCKRCGTPVFNLNSKHVGACMLYLGTIDGSSGYSPSLNVHCESMLCWLGGVTSLEGLQQGPELR